VRLAVVGGGISGLAAAWELSRRGAGTVTIFEPERVGGKIRTAAFAGRPVDEGPDAFLVRTPEAQDLCREIGLTDLAPPAAGRTLLWTRGRLRPLPDGLILGVPGRLGPVMRSGLLSARGMARAGLDLVLPSSTVDGDVSVGTLVARRFGREVSTRLVEPLLGGIHAASLDELSSELTAPQLLAAARSSRSLLRGLQAQARDQRSGGPIFLAPVGGTGQMVDELERSLRRAGVEFRFEPVGRIEPADEGRTPLDLVLGAGRERFDGAVVAVPAPRAAELLGPHAPDGLDAIRYTSVALLTVAVPEDWWRPPTGFNGFLVPHNEQRLMTACSFFTNKWPDPATPGRQVLRISAGHSRDHRVDTLDDEAITKQLLGELAEATGCELEPIETRLSRWPGALPLYQVGHAASVAAIEAELTRTVPGAALAGAGYRGAGIPACIRSGRAAAVAVAEAAAA